MSNIKTRKGLAFGALVALGASLIAGAPAHAAGEVNVVPSAGSLLSTLSTETFTLKSNLTSNNNTPQNIADIRYQVKSTSAINAETWQGNGNSDVYQLLTTTTDHKIDFAATGAASALNYLALSAADTTKAASVEVTTYVDADNSGSFTAGEFNNVQTISFKLLSAVTTAVVLDTPHEGDTNVTGNVTLDGINLSQIQSGVFVGASFYNSTERTYGNETVVGDVLPTGKFDISFAVGAAGSNVAARAYLGESETAFATTIKKTVAHTVGDLDATVVAGPNAVGGHDSEVRPNAPYVVTAIVHDMLHTLADAKVVAGATVTASFATGVSLDATHTITINGVTYTTNADLNAAAVKLTSGADGKVSLNVTTVGFVDGNSVGFHFDSEHFNDTASALVADAQYNLIDTADLSNHNARSAVAGSTTNVSYTVVDQYGQAPANGKYAVHITGETGITEAHADVVNGVATAPVAIAANAVTSVYDVHAELWVYGTDHTFATAEETGIWENGGFELFVAPTAEITPATVTVHEDSTQGGDIGKYAFSAFDSRFNGLFGYAQEPANWGDGDWTFYTATVNAGDVATHSVAGASVTISAPGLLIINENDLQAAVGSLTLLADENGQVVFAVESHKAGKQDVTVTSGAATKTVTTSNTWVARTASTIAASVASASYTTGRTVLVEFTAADMWGNAANVEALPVKVAGVGYLIGSDNTIGTSAVVDITAGKGAVQLVDGADQIGSAVVTATLPIGVDNTAAVSAASSYTFGQTDANLNISGKRVTADWVFAAGKTVTITRDGVTIRTFHPTANSADSFSFNLKKSKRAHRVTIKVNGVTITDAGYLVKK